MTMFDTIAKNPKATIIPASILLSITVSATVALSQTTVLQALSFSATLGPFFPVWGLALAIGLIVTTAAFIVSLAAYRNVKPGYRPVKSIYARLEKDENSVEMTKDLFSKFLEEAKPVFKELVEKDQVEQLKSKIEHYAALASPVTAAKTEFNSFITDELFSYALEKDAEKCLDHLSESPFELSEPTEKTDTPLKEREIYTDAIQQRKGK